jgi:phosphoserine phosphatase
MNMFVVTMLCNPANPVLEPAIVEAVRNAWGGGDVLWLAPDVAVEFSIPAIPSNRWGVWQEMQEMAVDLVIQPAEGRKKQMLLADMDSTMIQQECIDELAAEAGIGAHVAKITARAMNGELGFEASLIERVGLLKGLPTSVIKTVLAKRITLMAGAKPLLATMKANGAYAALVSGGFTDFTGKIAKDLGFDENRANRLLIENDTLSGAVAMPILGRDAKVSALNEITAKLGIDAKQVLAVGDGANDLGMLGAAGAGVALHAKPSVAAQCDIRINKGDLTALLYIQGYSRDDFIS